jgi:hypothetical protein
MTPPSTNRKTRFKPAGKQFIYRQAGSNQPKRNQMKPEQIAGLIDQLIVERLRLHLLGTSKSIGESLDKRELAMDFEKKIVQIKANLAEALRA